MRAKDRTPFNYAYTEGPAVLSTKRRARIEFNRQPITREVVDAAIAEYLAKGGVIRRIEAEPDMRDENPLLSTFDLEYTNRLTVLGNGTWQAPSVYNPIAQRN